VLETQVRFGKKDLPKVRPFLHQISITSKTGVGSTTLFSELKKRFDAFPYRWVSGGSLMRARAAELGMNIGQFAAHNRVHPEEGHDRWCDDTIAHFAEHDWVICESRLSHVFMPGAFKVLLVCDPEIRAERQRAISRSKSLKQIREEIENRDRDDDARYVELYPDCLWGQEDFDLVMNTGVLSLAREMEALLNHYEKWQKNGIK
jgi:cytidylate kinase